MVEIPVGKVAVPPSTTAYVAKQAMKGKTDVWKRLCINPSQGSCICLKRSEGEELWRENWEGRGGEGLLISQNLQIPTLHLYTSYIDYKSHRQGSGCCFIFVPKHQRGHLVIITTALPATLSIFTANCQRWRDYIHINGCVISPSWSVWLVFSVRKELVVVTVCQGLSYFSASSWHLFSICHSSMSHVSHIFPRSHRHWNSISVVLPLNPPGQWIYHYFSTYFVIVTFF